MNTNTTVNWSSEQQAIFAHFRNACGTKRNAKVEAMAGTGKTTTIKEAFNYALERRMLYVVFNKKNQVEAAEKIRDCRVEVLTLHSLGFRFIKKIWANTKPDDGIEQERALAALGGVSDAAMIASVTKLVAFLKNTTINPSYEQAYEVAVTLELVGNMPEADKRLVDAGLKVLELSKVQDLQGRISFNDMVWLPVAMGWVQPTYDLVVVDEAQDMNAPQLEMAVQACKPTGRIVIVGDSRQAIYGFRGAVQNGLEVMARRLNAAELTLTVTYRCPKKVVALAQKEVPAYQAAESAPEGLVEPKKESEMLRDVKPGDAILSRLNAPLMPLVLALLRKNIPARIEGRDIGKQLIGTVGKVNKLRLSKEQKGPNTAGEIELFLIRLTQWQDREVAKVATWKNGDKKAEQITDVAETLRALAMDCTSVRQVEQRLETLFQDTTQYSKSAVVLSSVHKAKGLEWKRVWMLEHTFRRSKGGEEANIWYVAVTRSQDCLYLVGQGKDEPKQEQKPAVVAPEPSTTSTMERAAITVLTVCMAAAA